MKLKPAVLGTRPSDAAAMGDDSPPMVAMTGKAAAQAGSTV